MFYQLFSVIAPVFVCAVIGYIWRKQGRAYDTAFVTTLVTNVGTPCLVSVHELVSLRSKALIASTDYPVGTFVPNSCLEISISASKENMRR